MTCAADCGRLYLISIVRSRLVDLWQNDWWVWDPVTTYWTWIGGTTTGYGASSYGTLNTPASTNIPGARSGHAMTIHPVTRVIYLFGGYGNTVSVSINGYLNDLWAWNPATTYWTWIGGTSSVNSGGVYGTKGVESASSYPGGRQNHGLVIDPRNGNFYLFGGWGYYSAGTICFY